MDEQLMHYTLCAQNLTLAYDEVEVARELSVDIPTGKITCIVGANACGKSTLLRALARLLKPKAGVVLLDGESIHRLSTKVVATRLGIRRGFGSGPVPTKQPSRMQCARRGDRHGIGAGHGPDVAG